MKLLIAYYSKNGTTYKCAQMLAERLPQRIEVEIFNLANGNPSLDGIDAIVIGGAVRMSSLNKNVKKFIKNNLDKLNSIPCAVYLCCGLMHEFEYYADTLIDRKLICSLGVHCFGGELKPDKLRGFDKLFVRIARSELRSAEVDDISEKDIGLPEILPESIYSLAERIKRL